MKKLLISLLLFLTACTEKTEYGRCIGAFDEQDTKLTYKVNTTNVVVGIVFFETLIIPTIVVLDQIKCPVGEKK